MNNFSIGLRNFMEPHGTSRLFVLLALARDHKTACRAYFLALAALLATLQADLSVQGDFPATLQADLSVQDDILATLQADHSVQDDFLATLQADPSVQVDFLATLQADLSIQDDFLATLHAEPSDLART